MLSVAIIGLSFTGNSGKRLRSVDIVRQDFRKLRIGLKRKYRRELTYLSDRKYDALCGRLESFKEVKPFDALIIDSAKELEKIDFSSLSDDFLSTRLKGRMLDLTNQG